MRALYRLTKIIRDGETVHAEGEYVFESGGEKVWSRAAMVAPEEKSK